MADLGTYFASSHRTDPSDPRENSFQRSISEKQFDIFDRRIFPVNRKRSRDRVRIVEWPI